MKKLSLLELANVYGGFDNDKCREVQKRGAELDKRQNGRATVCNTLEEEKKFQENLEKEWAKWIEQCEKYCM
ncbi:hypothetical protein [Prevotella nigrescens]|jgi:hypothetical protein|uniref:hypothetical protein n=1 Tax=Prevotella nigrescens TaxID=28133 RepID=UPI0024333306|nr:hypothetical protein [Prevotella nigrescens]